MRVALDFEERPNRAALRDRLFRHSLCHLARILVDAGDERVSVRPLLCAIVIGLDDERLAARKSAAQNDHDAARLNDSAHDSAVLTLKTRNDAHVDGNQPRCKDSKRRKPLMSTQTGAQ